jgi:O-antigen ligase
MSKPAYPSMVWLFVLGIVGYPITASLTNIAGVDNQPFAVAFRAAYLAYSLALLWIAFKDNAPILKTSFWLLYFAFWGMYLLRILYDTVIEDVPTAFQKENYLIFSLGVTLIPSLAFARQIDVSTARVAFLRTTVFLAITQVLFLLGVQTELEGSLDFKRLQTETLNAISYGVLGAMSVALGGLGLILPPQVKSRELSSKAVKVLFLASVALGASTIYLSGSRGPFLAASLCLMIIFLRALLRAGSKVGIAVFSVGAIISALLGLLPFLLDVDIPLFERLFRTFRREEVSDDSRFDLWRNGWQQFLEQPLFGSGLEEKTYVYYPHNLPLEAFMATGVFGGVIWLGLLLVGIRRAIQIVWLSLEFAWIGVLFILLMANSLFSGNFWNAGPVAYLLVALYAVPVGAKAPSRPNGRQVLAS